MANDPIALNPDALQTALEQLPDWRAEKGALITAYAAPSAAAALALIAAIGDAAEAANHHPDVDWRYDHVFVLTTTHQIGGKVTALDVELARQVSGLAGAAGATAEPDRGRPGA
jgi:4a-hydroxytetrahydrobiopterin dehydratase